MGWYPDPEGAPRYRFHDGSQWIDAYWGYERGAPNEKWSADPYAPHRYWTETRGPGFGADRPQPRSARAEPSQPPSERTSAAGGTVTQPERFSVPGCLFGIVILVALIWGIVGCIQQQPSRTQSSLPSVPEQCMSIVANWLDQPASAVQFDGELAGNSLGEGVDFAGTYPGGEWRCAARAGAARPSQVMIYPGGYGNIDIGIPEQIYP